jgi:SP family general alpha glucoside:H+ symporter-like MFS transporter
MNMLSYLQSVTNIIAAQVAGSLSQRYGYRPLLLSALVIMAGAIFVPFFAPSLPVLLVGELLCGIPWGVFAVLAPSYASEVCPVVLRGYLTAYLNLCWIIGQLINAGVVYGLQDYQGQWSYRIPFAIQWVWVIPLFCLIFLAPESPWWYVRKGRLEEAERSLKRLSDKSTAVNSKQTVAMMVHTNNFEKEEQAGTSILDCFKGSNLRRTEIACVIYGIQPMASGAQIPGTYFFEQIGLSVRASFGMGLGATSIAFCTSIFAWVVMGLSGRRKMLLGGMTGQVIVLLIIGFLALGPSSNPTIPWVQGGFALFFNVCYNLSIGVLAFTIFSEVSSTRLRGRTVALAKNVNAVSGIVVGVVGPYFINPENLNWKGKVAFFWAGVNVLCIIWVYFRLPELKGRTYEEIDILFAKGVKARDFRKFVVDPYDQDEVTKT